MSMCETNTVVKGTCRAKGRQQVLEGVWQSQWAVIRCRLVCLFSGSCITAYTRSRAAGVRPIPFSSHIYSHFHWA